LGGRTLKKRRGGGTKDIFGVNWGPLKISRGKGSYLTEDNYKAGKEKRIGAYGESTVKGRGKEVEVPPSEKGHYQDATKDQGEHIDVQMKKQGERKREKPIV